jgi:hypothetical protein
MTTRRSIAAVMACVLLATAMTTSIASAHNAGHTHLPTGVCLDVGSGKHHTNPMVDRYPATSGDEYGARWAADQGKTPIYARFCDDPRPGTHDH